MNSFTTILKKSCKVLTKTLVLSWIVYQGFLPGSTSNTDTTSEYHKELSCLHELLFYEARNTSYSSMTKVAKVVQNRTNAKGFPSSYCGVSKQRFQFSYHMDKHKQSVNTSQYSMDSAAWETAGTIARDTLDNTLSDPFKYLGGDSVLYYHTPAVKPKWSQKMKKVLQDKYHMFFKKVKPKKN